MAHVSDAERDKAFYFVNHICILEDGLILVQGIPTHIPRFGDLVSFNPHLPHKHADIPRFSGFSLHSITPPTLIVPSLTQVEVDKLLAARDDTTALASVTSALAANHEAAGPKLEVASWETTATSMYTFGVDLKAGDAGVVSVPLGSTTAAVGLDLAFKFDKASQYASEIAGGVVVNWVNPPPLSGEQQEWIDAHFSRHFTWGMISSLYYASCITEHAGDQHTFTGSAVADVTPTTQARLNAALRGGYSLSHTAASVRSNAIAAYQLTPVHSSNTDEKLPGLACWNCFGHPEELPSVLKNEGYGFPETR